MGVKPLTVGACFAYYLLLFLGRSAALSGTIPSFAGVWLPNVVLVLLSMLLLEVGSPLETDSRAG